MHPAAVQGRPPGDHGSWTLRIHGQDSHDGVEVARPVDKRELDPDLFGQRQHLHKVSDSVQQPRIVTVPRASMFIDVASESGTPAASITDRGGTAGELDHRLHRVAARYEIIRTHLPGEPPASGRGGDHHNPARTSPAGPYTAARAIGPAPSTAMSVPGRRSDRSTPWRPTASGSTIAPSFQDNSSRSFTAWGSPSRAYSANAESRTDHFVVTRAPSLVAGPAALASPAAAPDGRRADPITNRKRFHPWPDGHHLAEYS